MICASAFFGREGLPASADVLSRRMKEAEDAAASGKHRLAGRVPGCLFFFTFHSSVVLVNHDGSKQMQDIRVAHLGKAEVLMGKNTMIQKGLNIGHNEYPDVDLDKLRAYMKGNLGFIFATNCILRCAGREQAMARSQSGANL